MTHPAPQKPAPEPTNKAPAAPDPADYDIAFLQSGQVAYSVSPKHIQFAQFALIYGLMGTSIGIGNLLRLFGQAVHMSVGLAVGLIVLALVGVLVFLIRQDIKNTFEQGGAVPKDLKYEKHNTSRRIRITLRAVPSIRLLRSLPEAEHGFEPEIVRVPLAVGLDQTARKLAWLGGVIGMLVAVLIELYIVRSTEWMPFSIWFIMGMGCVGAIGVPEFFFPTYLRVIPGRLDVIRAPIVGDTLSVIHSYDLRTRPITIVGPIVYIEPELPAGQPRPELVENARWPNQMTYPPDFKPEAICLQFSLNRLRIIRAIVWAAITTAPTPEVPSDRLLG